MASTLSFPSITGLITTSSKHSKQSQRIRLFPLQQLFLPSSSKLCLSRKLSSSWSSSAASVPHAATEEVPSKSLISDCDKDSQTNNSTLSSSKLVLVVGGSGGVGNGPFLSSVFFFFNIFP